LATASRSTRPENNAKRSMGSGTTSEVAGRRSNCTRGPRVRCLASARITVPAGTFCSARMDSIEATNIGILEFDDETTHRLLAVYTTPEVVAQRGAFAMALDPRRGERVVDVGSGPGFFVSVIADAVGPAGLVYGIDTSEPLNAVARERAGGDARLQAEYVSAITALATERLRQGANIPRDRRRWLRMLSDMADTHQA